jgi:glycosyltransferase involved in cell wall biosynthesis
MKKLPLSVFIIAKDEADRITKPILSVRDWVDEVIVIDSGSSDNTVEVAKSLGAQTVFNAWNGYGPQKVFGETLCKNKWLFNIDADEEVTPALRDEIIGLFAGGEPLCNGYKMKITVFNRFAKKTTIFAPYSNQLRLYNKDYAGFKDSTVHDSVILKPNSNGQVAQLQNIMLHRTFRSYHHAVEKINRYTGMQAVDMVSHGRNPSGIRIIIEPFIAFLKVYFIRRHFLMGVEGFIEGVVYAFARTIRLAKARELWKEKEQLKGEQV